MKEINHNNISEIKTLIENAKSICLLGHHNPDGDAVAGCLALSRILSKLNKQNTVVMPSAIPDYLKFLPNCENIVIHTNGKAKAPNILTESELIICVDFNGAGRVKGLEKTLTESKALKIMLDHHPDPEEMADYALSIPEYSSASEIVFEFAEMLGYKKLIDTDTATALYTGIMTDTLNFSIETAHEKTFRRAAELLSYGIDKENIYDTVYNTYSWNRFKLIGHLLNNKTELIEEYQVAYTIFTQEDKKRFNYKTGDHEGIVNIALSVKDVKASILFMENDENIKVSARSKGELNVNLFASKYLNGGGHERAAGGTLTIGKEKIPEYLKAALKNFTNSSFAKKQ